MNERHGHLSHLPSAAVVAVIANVDRMHDEDMWPCSIPKTTVGPPSGLQSDRGGVAERQGWSCRATGVEVQSDRGGVEVVVDRDACCLEVQKI